MFYEEVFRELNKEKVKYVVVGGVAVVLHGLVRFTADVDLFVGFSEKNLLKFDGEIEAIKGIKCTGRESKEVSALSRI